MDDCKCFGESEVTRGTLLNWLEFFVEALLIMHIQTTQRAIP